MPLDSAAIQVASLSALRALFRMPPDCVAANLPPQDHLAPPLAEDASAIFQGAMANAPTWDDLAWLRSYCRKCGDSRQATHSRACVLRFWYNRVLQWSMDNNVAQACRSPTCSADLNLNAQLMQVCRSTVF